MGDAGLGRGEVTYVALLRGVNVGRANRVAMADLRVLAERLGFTRVRTLLNSGNLVFAARDTGKGSVAERLREALAADLGVSARVVVLTASELEEVLAANPLCVEGRDLSRLQVAFLESPADARKLSPLLDTDWGCEEMAVGGRAAYLWCPDGVIASRLVKAVERALGGAATSRNWATTMKLAALVTGR